MSNNTSVTKSNLHFTLCAFDGIAREHNPAFKEVILSILIIIAILSPIAVVGNAFVLAAIWKNPSLRTPSYILLCGLAFTDLFTGLVTQPFYVASEFMCLGEPQEIKRWLSFLYYVGVITGGCGTYFMCMQVQVITCMSIERWLHMTRRSLLTGRRAGFAVVGILLAPIPTGVFRALNVVTGNYQYVWTIFIALLLFCLITTSTAYFKVFRIIRRHQQQIQANESSQNSGQPAINLAKYKKSVLTILYIVAVFYITFLPLIVFFVLYSSHKDRAEIELAFVISMIFMFLSSSLNPLIYLWRMNDIRNGVKQLICKCN